MTKNPRSSSLVLFRQDIHMFKNIGLTCGLTPRSVVYESQASPNTHPETPHPYHSRRFDVLLTI
ncbi:hypothetical protein E2C01_090178 [Portunus trituberculatus]|uniref:Uncharacterized protein n=1 Tax=Portunus trituberculatus TaxID=210409 RepID=A0A5B7JL52_PORTR|nr:hypothetical protein [Portunus trituberculatus]